MVSETQKNHYAAHLTNVGESREVLASEDIYNEQGALLLKKGSPINKRISDQIVKFKLLKPIETSVNVEGVVNDKKLYQDLYSIFDKHPVLLQIHHAQNLEQPFKKLSLLLSKHPILMQKLTVMQVQLPKLYRQTVAVTWLSTAIARQMGAKPDSLEATFLAAIAHDIGMLHINPEVILKTESLTAEEWRQIQSHTVIGQKLIENLPGLNKSIARIVLEHHERCEGTGYPVGKFGLQLTLESQVIAQADSIISVYTNKLQEPDKTVRDLIPFLQVNSESHFYSTFSAIIKMFRTSNIEESCFINNKNISVEIKSVLTKNIEVTTKLKCLEALINEDILENRHKLISSAISITVQILKTVRGSGILDEGYIRWLEEVKNGQLSHAFREVADVSLMLSELDWQLDRAIKALNSYLHLETESDQELKSLIKDSLPTHNIQNPSSEFTIN